MVSKNNPENGNGELDPDKVNVLNRYSGPPKRKYPGRKVTLEKIDPSIYAEYLQRVELGSYAHVAAASLGICQETFIRWMKRGKEEKRGIYHQFYQDTIKASGQAQFMAEVLVKSQSPLAWLSRGPGKRDWYERTEIDMSGGLSLDVDQEVTHHDGEENQVARTFADALAVFDQLGLLKLSKEGMQLFLPSPPEKVDPTQGSNGNGNGNGEVTIDDIIGD